jgi:hypothetical protein
MSEEQLRDLFRTVKTLSKRLSSDGPQNDDELHLWVKVNIGVDIPRVAVCEDHDPPFKLLADAYFYRLEVEIEGEKHGVAGVLALANRGGSKTFITAILHYLNATYKPGHEGLQFGATEAQGNRCYTNVEDWCYEHDSETGRRLDVVKDYIEGRPMKSETKWKTGSRVEVVPGSEAAVSGPHPQTAGADEIELMEDGVWNQSRGMAVAKQATGKLPEFMDQFNGIIPPLDVATSTRNSLKGRMHELLTEIEADLRAGNIPEFKIVKWCIWETVQEVPHCRCVDKKQREKRLLELGRDPSERCACNRVVKGWNMDGSSRTLEQVCGGKAFRARGWKPYIDLRTTFKRNTPGTWKLQHECREGHDENAYIENWSLEFYGVRNYEPRPEYGPIYVGIDWGADHPACVLWFQYLRVEVPAYDFNYEPIWLESDTYVGFREIYTANKDAPQLAERVIQIEDRYRAQYGHAWRVAERFADPAGKGEKISFRRAGLPCGAWPVVTRDKVKMITTVQNLVIDDRWAVDVDGCTNWTVEVESWQKNPKTGKELDKHNHAMAAWRYGISNAEVVIGKLPPLGVSKPKSEAGKSATTSNNGRGDEMPDRENLGPVSLSRGRRHATDQFKDALTQ